MMANDSDTPSQKMTFFEKLKHFPVISNGKININEFLEAAADLLLLLDRLGKVFTPAKYDMQGNIEKIRKIYEYNDDSCLLELMINERHSKPSGIESVVWLNRALKFIDLSFQELFKCLRDNDTGVSSNKIFSVAYEGSLKKYHNWVTQKIFTFICKMTPTISQILKNIECDGDSKVVEACMSTYHKKLHLVRCMIDNVIIENNLFDE